ncbi:MAG: hypothetical protein E6Q97_19940 [Desulfurellales bacterium]|nr:MAG: hypothetical protein E6Q97_19940 [Desulfurellales bacterium]
MGVDFTKAFSKAYDGLRRVTQPVASPLRLLDNDGAELATIEKGWIFEEVSGEEIGERVIEVRVTDRTGIEFEDAIFLVFNGRQYERLRSPNPPAGNPREWTWRCKPVGTDPDTDDE